MYLVIAESRTDNRLSQCLRFEAVGGCPVVHSVLGGQQLLVPISQNPILLQLSRNSDSSACGEFDATLEVAVADGLVQSRGVELGRIALISLTLGGRPVLVDLKNRLEKNYLLKRRK